MAIYNIKNNLLSQAISFEEAIQNDIEPCLSTRLEYAMRLLKINQTELAKRIDVKPQVIQYLCNKKIKSSLMK